MRIRAQHYVIFCMAILVGFVGFAVYWSSRQEVDTGDSADEFLSKLNEARGVNEGVSAGLLPSVDMDPSFVAKIELETTDLDLGVIANDKVHQAKLKVYNRGKRPLIISDIQTTCICTQGALPQERATVPPGGETYIDIFVNPDRIPGFFSQKTLTISSNDPQTTQATVKVRANVDPEFSLEPEEMKFGEIVKGATPSLTLRLRELQAEPFDVTGVSRQDPAGTPEFEGTVTPVPEDQWKTPGKREYDITVTLLPNLPVGDFSRYAYLDTTVRRPAGFPIALTAHITAPYSMDPAPPKLLVIRPGIAGSDGKRATAVVTADTPVTISDVQAKEGKLSFELRPGDTPNQMLFVVSIPDHAPPGRIDEEFTFNITTEKGTFREKLTVRGYVRDPDSPAEGAEADPVPGTPVPATPETPAAPGTADSATPPGATQP